MPTKDLTKQTTSVPSLFDEFFRPWSEWFSNGPFTKVATIPAVNIKENDADYRVSVAVPGLDKNDFTLDIDGNILTIRAEKEENKEEKDENLMRREYNYSSFSRSFSIPEDVNRDAINATYQNGELELVLPRKEEARKSAVKKQIKVS